MGGPWTPALGKGKEKKGRGERDRICGTFVQLYFPQRYPAAIYAIN